MMETILEPLLQSPQLPRYYRQLGDLLAQEKVRRQEFYDSLTEDQKAEFINGRVVVQSPVRMQHDFVSSNLQVLLRSYVMTHKIGYVGHEKLLVSLTRNDYEPDVSYWRQEVATTFQPDQLHFPAPDLIAEVLSPATIEIDRSIKFDDYAAHAVSEYWILDPETQTVEQYVLKGEAYELRQKIKNGRLESVVVPGFDLSVRALFDEQRHLETLRKILAGGKEISDPALR